MTKETIQVAETVYPSCVCRKRMKPSCSRDPSAFGAGDAVGRSVADLDFLLTPSHCPGVLREGDCPGLIPPLVSKKDSMGEVEQRGECE